MNMINLPTTYELVYRKAKNSKYFSTSWKCKMSNKELKQWQELIINLNKLIGMSNGDEILMGLITAEQNREEQYREIINNLKSDEFKLSKLNFIKYCAKSSKFFKLC